MEGTAKLTTGNVAAKVKADLTDRLSREMVMRTDDFTKLLQQKKDLTQTKEQTKTDSTKDTKPKDKDVSAADGKTEKPQTQTQDKDMSEEELQQEAMLQSAQQQAMAQMNLVQAQIQPETIPEAIIEPTAGAAVQAVETAAVLEEQPQVLAEAASQTAQIQEDLPLSGRPGALRPGEALGTDKAETAQEEQPAAAFTDVVAQSRKTEDAFSAPEKSMESSVQTQAGQKSQETRQEDGKDVHPLANEDTFRTSMETRESAFAGKTEQVPVKTTPETMPQDLGQTLAGRLGNGPKTIVIELEPASLGRLTIRLTYEASRAALSIAASNPKTLELLNQKAGEIAQILEEKTGQETLIFTQPTEQEPQYEDGRSSQDGAQQEGRKERQQDRQQEEQQAASFAQQLRLGLI